MTKSFILLASIIFTSLSSFGQTGQQVERKAISASESVILRLPVRGCSRPIVQYNPASCCAQVIRKEEKTEESLDITDPELDGIGVAPNPTKGFLAVSVSPDLIGYEIQVIDMTGRFVGNPTPITGATENLTIEGESGVYLISIRTEKKVFTERVFLDK